MKALFTPAAFAVSVRTLTVQTYCAFNERLRKSSPNVAIFFCKIL